MRILYVSQYFPPEIGAPAARVSELSKHWVRHGHEVTVLTGFPNHPDGKVHPGYEKKLRRLTCRERWEGVEVVRTWLMPLPNRKPWERIGNYTSFCVSAALRGLPLPRPDVVIATSPQLLVGVAGWWLARLKRVPLVFEVRDIWPDAIVASGVGSPDSALARILTAISRFMHRKADRIVVVTDAFERELVEAWGVDSGKISVVPNGVDLELFTPEERPPEASGSTFTVSYVGTLGLAHGLDLVLDAAGRLRSRPIRFLIVGEGAERRHLEARIGREGLDNVSVLGQLPRREIPGVIAGSDACLVLLKPAPIFETVIPTKMLEFMACGRPVILGVKGQARAVLEEAQAGITISPGDPDQLIEAIQRLCDDPRLRLSLGRNGRRFIEDRMSRAATAERYIRALKDISVPIARSRGIG